MHVNNIRAYEAGLLQHLRKYSYCKDKQMPLPHAINTILPGEHQLLEMALVTSLVTAWAPASKNEISALLQ